MKLSLREFYNPMGLIREVMNGATQRRGGFKPPRRLERCSLVAQRSGAKQSTKFQQTLVLYFL